MRKKIIIFALLLFSTNTLIAQCPTSNLTLSTQSQINNFATNYPNCTVLNYNLTISGNSITNLNGLSNITSTTKQLDINNCPNLTDVSGLNNLTSATGTMFRFLNNPLLTSLPSFESLTTVNSLVIINSNFMTVNSFSNLNNLNSLFVSNCPNLSSISSFGSLTSNLNNLYLNNLPELNSLSGLSNLDVINRITMIDCNSTNLLAELNAYSLLNNLDYLFLSDNSLVNLQALSNLQSVNQLQIVNCNVENLEELQNLNTLSNLIIDDCDSLINLNGLQNINECSVEIKNCSALLNLGGLDNIHNLDGFILTNNSVLNDISSLSNLTTINGYGDFKIQNNNSLTSLQGLDSLVTIGPVFEISNNNSLSSISALSNLTTMSHIEDPTMDNLYFGITNNPNLITLSGLDNLQLDDANGYFNLNIYNNSSLTFGAVESICTYLNLGKPSTINSNSVGCNSAQEILSVCQTLSISQSDLENIELYPNPTTNNFFISGNDFVGMKFTIMDNLGRRMNYKKMAENEISIENLPAGIYIVKFVFGEKTNYKKIIKK